MAICTNKVSVEPQQHPKQKERPSPVHPNGGSPRPYLGGVLQFPVYIQKFGRFSVWERIATLSFK